MGQPTKSTRDQILLQVKIPNVTWMIWIMFDILSHLLVSISVWADGLQEQFLRWNGAQSYKTTSRPVRRGDEKSIQQTQAKAECTETNLHTFADSQGRASTVGHQWQRLGVGQNVLWERGGVQTLKHQITLLKQVSTTHKTDLFAKKGLHSLKKAIFVSELTWASSCCLSFLALFCLK